MHPDTDYLKTIAKEIAANAVNNELKSEKANHHLEREAKRLEKAIIQSLYSIENFTQRDTFHFNTLNKLVNVCDILFDISHAVTDDVMVILELLAGVKEILPNEIRPNLRLAKAFIVLQQPVMDEHWATHHREMQKQGISPNLTDIAGIPFKRFALSKYKLYWSDFTWLKGYLAKLEIIDWEHADCNSPEEALLSLLIGRDFNHDRFYVYCKKYVIGRVKAANNKRNRLLELAACEKLILQDTQFDVPSFDVHANSVSTRLVKWIKEEIDFVETHEREQPHAKLGFQFYKYTLAFFFKLLHEQKIFGDISFQELSKQIAATCTAMGADVPPETMVKKAYLKKQVDFKRMEALLLAMLSYLRRFM